MSWTMRDDSPHDKDLVRAYLNGDSGAFGELVRRYQNMVYNLCYRLVGRTDEAEDLTQDIFIRLLDKVSSWRGEAKFSTWLYRLAINHCRDHLRKYQPQMVELNDLLRDGGGDPARAAEAGELRESIFSALLRLPLDWREVVFLRDVEGFTYQEIAEILRVELGTVKSRLARARSRLIATLEQTTVADHQRG